jgi:hypothetical protein
VPVVRTTVSYPAETAESFAAKGTEQRVCANLVRASGYDPTLARCSVTSITDAPQGGILVTYQVIFNVRDSSQASLDAAQAAADQLTAAIGGQGRLVTGTGLPLQGDEIDMFEGGTVVAFSNNLRKLDDVQHGG